MSMLGGNDADVHRAKAMGISLFAGEAEGRLEQVLQDAYAKKLKPLYNFMADLPGIEGMPIPLISSVRAARTAGHVTSFDAGRGCPFQCSFCTIINVQGRKSRRRSPDDVEKIIRENVAQGLRSFFITDDNFARNKDWEAILDRIIRLREVDKLKPSFIIQVDTLCHKLPNFIEKCARAGVRRVFIGLENINPDSLAGAHKRQNKITEYRKMLLAWKAAKIITYCGYITGFPNDTVESIKRDIEIVKKELPLDILEFFYLTPLPGSEDHQKLVNAGIAVDPDLNKYDLNHVCTAHPKMSREEWERAYLTAWETYYTMEHMETVLRRLVAKKGRANNALVLITWFMSSIHLEKVHPLEGGVIRLKSRRDRRPGLPIEPIWTFYPKYWVESVIKIAKLVTIYSRLRRIYKRIKEDPEQVQIHGCRADAGHRSRHGRFGDVSYALGAGVRRAGATATACARACGGVAVDAQFPHAGWGNACHAGPGLCVPGDSFSPVRHRQGGGSPRQPGMADGTFREEPAGRICAGDGFAHHHS